MPSLLACDRQPHAASCYAHCAEGLPIRAPLAGEVTTSVCVVGGGLSGLSAALELALAGMPVILLEGSRLGWAASGRNGGQVINGYACGQPWLEAQLGQDDALRMWRWSLEGVEMIRQRCRRYAIDCDLQFGYVQVANHPRHMDALIDQVEQMESAYQYPELTLMDRGALRYHVASDRYLGGMFDNCSGHLHPLRYTLGLAQALEEEGGRIHEGSCVRNLDFTGGKVRVETAGGVVRCDQVVLAGNAHLGRLVPELRRKIMPVGTYMIATEPLGRRVYDVLPTGAAVCDSRHILDYFRLSAEGRLLFGGKVSYSGWTPWRVQQGLRRNMLKVFPHLADVRIDHCWGGLVDISRSRAPHLGRFAAGRAFYMQGFSGHGVALSGLAGRVIAEAVQGKDRRLAVFERLRHADFPGGRLLRRPALMAGMCAFRLRDWLPG